MFKQNKYTKWYFNIIENSNADNIVVEKHHIIPKSLGGSDDESNIVKLTPREHYICHKLLTKMVEGKFKMKMTFALHTFFHFNKHRRLNFTSHQYEYHKTEFLLACRQRAPHYKKDVFYFKHMDSLEEFVGTRREFINYTKISAQSANFLFNEARFIDKPMKYIKRWGIRVEGSDIYSFEKTRPKRKLKYTVCEYCGKKVDILNYSKWHGDNCKIVDKEGHQQRIQHISELNKN